MRKLIEESLKKLGLSRQAFHSEDDFKFALCRQLIMIDSGLEIRLEVPFPIKYKYYNYGQDTKDEKEKTAYIDLIVQDKSSKCALELKYRTKKTNFNICNESYELRNHSARDVGRYKYRADVSRLENLVNSKKIDKGYAIFLTNDQLFWADPIDVNNMDREFRLGDENLKKEA